MIWELNDEFRIKVIPLNFVVEQYREGKNPKTKETVWKWHVCGYYSSLEKAISSLPDEVAQHPEIEDYRGLRERIDKLAGQLSRRVGGV